MSGAIAMGALLTGCQTTPGMTGNNTQGTVTTYQITNSVLQANNWQLVDAKTADGKRVDALFTNTAKPLTLNFSTYDGDNIVSLMNTCNKVSAPYSVVNGNVQLGNMISTMMACPDAEAKFDSAAVASVMGKYTLSQSNNNAPMLIVTNDKQVSHFRAVGK